MIDTFSILYNSTHYFVLGEKKLFFFPKFLLVCDCDFTEFFSIVCVWIKYWRNYIF